MKCRPVEEIVFDHMFPKPKVGEPQNFQAFLQRHLVPEVRQETHSFYGHLDTQEAKYPGLDYSHPTHRLRLGRFTWHRRLFRAFDNLGLTKHEISILTRWEGTKWAKEKYEKEQGVIIRDTTADGFPEWIEPAPIRTARDDRSQVRITTTVYTAREIREEEEEEQEQSEVEVDEDDEESEPELESVGVELNQRLRTQAARREAGEPSVVLDEEWEQWLKNAIESGDLTVLTEHMTQQIFRRSASSSLIPAAIIPQGMLALARSGQWSDIPEFLHPMLRRALRGENPSPRGSTNTTASNLSRSTPRRVELDIESLVARQRVGGTRRTYTDLLLPNGAVELPASQAA